MSTSEPTPGIVPFVTAPHAHAGIDHSSDAESFQLPTTTVWSFPERGRWAGHRGDYRGNWAPQIPRSLILRYTRPGDMVLDAMCGSGTSLIECALLGRTGIGIDVNTPVVRMAAARARVAGGGATALCGDARALPLPDESTHLYLAHPPYHNIIEYSLDNAGDLSRINDLSTFLREIRRVAAEAKRVVRPAGHVAILVGDIRRRGEYVPLAYLCLREFVRTGLHLKEDIIKVQWNCRGTRRWAERGPLPFHLIAHEHLFVLERD